MKLRDRFEEKGVVIDKLGRRFSVRGNYPWLNNPSCDRYVLIRPKAPFTREEKS